MSDEPTFTEKVEAEVKPASKPEGSPNLVPLKALPRRRKAELMRKFAVVNDKRDELGKLREQVGEGKTDPAAAAALFDLVADVEEMLAEAADDREAFDAWLPDSSESDVMALFGWYVSTFQVGE